MYSYTLKTEEGMSNECRFFYLDSRMANIVRVWLWLQSIQPVQCLVMVEDPLKVQKEKSSDPQCFYLGDCYKYHRCSFVILPLSTEKKINFLCVEK